MSRKKKDAPAPTKSASIEFAEKLREKTIGLIFFEVPEATDEEILEIREKCTWHWAITCACDHRLIRREIERRVATGKRRTNDPRAAIKTVAAVVGVPPVKIRRNAVVFDTFFTCKEDRIFEEPQECEWPCNCLDGAKYAL